MSVLNQQTAINTGAAGTAGTTSALAIFGNYSTEWTLLLTVVATSVLIANSVVIKKRADRKEQREIEAHKKLMGKTEGPDDGQSDGIS